MLSKKRLPFWRLPYLPAALFMSLLIAFALKQIINVSMIKNLKPQNLQLPAKDSKENYQDIDQDRQLLVKDLQEKYQHPSADKDLYDKIITDTGYLKNPKAYLERWGNYKGTSHHAKAWHARLCQEAESVANTKSKSFYQYVTVVLDTGILTDPKGYLEQWNDQRGGTDEFRVPEDEAKSFLEKALL